MGAWGTGLFSDDVAADVRDSFTDYIGEGLDPKEATARTLDEFKDVLEDEDDACVVWLALAATQWKLGRLQDEVRERALRMIGSGDDLKRWDDAASVRSREKHLSKLRQQLLSPQPPVKKVRRRKKSSTSFRPGDIVRYRLEPDRSILFRVADVWGDRGGSYANIRLLCVDDGAPFNPQRFGEDLARPDRPQEPWRNYTMIDHEPLDRVEIVMRDVGLHDRRTPPIIAAGVGRNIGGIACNWKQFDDRARKAINSLGWS